MYYLDWSDNDPPLLGQFIRAEAKDVEGVIRYITSPELMQPPLPGNPKHITKTEFESHLQNSIKVMFVYQGTTSDADGGFAIGVRNAKRAMAGHTYLGSAPRVVFFTNDRTTLPSVATWREYLDGAASVLGIERVGAYGFGNAIDAAVGHAKFFWQAGSKNSVRPFVNFWQDNNTQITVHGVVCDRNLVINDPFPSPPPPPSPPAPVEEEVMQLDDVVYTDVNGHAYTVRELLSQRVQQPVCACGHVCVDRFQDISSLLYALSGQATWAEVASQTWADLATKRWCNL